MIFVRFFRACSKYGFTFIFSSYSNLKLVIRPNDTYKNIELVEKYPFYNKLFIRAIKEMKQYRNSHQ